MIPLRYNVRSLAVRKATTAATALGIGLVVFVLSTSQMLADGIQHTLGSAGEPGRAIVLRKGADNELVSTIDAKLVNVIMAAGGVRRDERGPRGVAELLTIIALPRTKSATSLSNVAVRGISDRALDFRSEAKLIAGRAPRIGADEAMIGRRLRGQYRGLQLGQSFVLKKNLSVRVVGVFDAGGSVHESEIWCDAQLVQSAFGREGLLSSVTVELQSHSAFAGFRSAIERERSYGLSVERESAYYEKQSEGTATLVRFLGGAVVVFFSIGASIGATITMYAAVAQRRREVGTLRALGFSRSAILSSFLIESLLLALFGGAIGAACSLAMGQLELTMVNFSTLSEMTFAFHASASMLLVALAVGILMGLAGGLLPAIRAARVSPIEAMREA